MITFWSRKIEQGDHSKSDLCADLISLRQPPQRVSETLRGLKKGSLLLDDPLQDDLPHYVRGDLIVDEKGNIKPNWIVPFGLLPKGAKPWLREFKKEASDLLTNYIRVMRWRQAASGTHRPFGMVGFYWSDDGGTWNNVPTEYQVFARQSQGFDMRPDALAATADLIAANALEPFAHELIREAGHLASNAPRSALLIAFSALETGLKAHVAYLLKGSETLLAKLPSPPVNTLLSEVIPELHSRAGIKTEHVPLAKPAREYLTKWVTQRNQVAHGVKQTVDGEDLNELIRFVSDILYVLDACRGKEWALAHLRSGHFSA
ncbi:hypothetical protein [Bosea sp. 685]|uniref:hypothetical protein n=1 Tax=Bosea sp. 685 TaxID=3080057 RepID=UPI002893530A|nr:hypothetical protein [Bosea sp. 685]WNJ88395.1 hypothetical protein RMR04_18475 [Bosea sp. 685]